MFTKIFTFAKSNITQPGKFVNILYERHLGKYLHSVAKPSHKDEMHCP